MIYLVCCTMQMINFKWFFKIFFPLIWGEKESDLDIITFRCVCEIYIDYRVWVTYQYEYQVLITFNTTSYLKANKSYLQQSKGFQRHIPVFLQLLYYYYYSTIWNIQQDTKISYLMPVKWRHLAKILFFFLRICKTTWWSSHMLTDTYCSKYNEYIVFIVPCYSDLAVDTNKMPLS